jgi:HEXXH motif-containing protein
VVPLATPEDPEEPVDRAVSAASRLAHGCVAFSDPADAATLALLLVHEVRHMTLGAALDLADLYEGGGRPRHHAPWRLDPRPVGALLQGAYAHIGVTEFWSAHRTRATGAERSTADLQFAYWREVTTRAVRTLAESGELTPLGVRFVDGLVTVTREWWEEMVGAGLAAQARDRADAEAITWRVMNPDLVGEVPERSPALDPLALPDDLAAR